MLTDEELHNLKRLLYGSRYEGQKTLSGLISFLEWTLCQSETKGKSIIEDSRQYKENWFHSLTDSLTMPCTYSLLVIELPDQMELRTP